MRPFYISLFIILVCSCESIFDVPLPEPTNTGNNNVVASVNGVNWTTSRGITSRKTFLNINDKYILVVGSDGEIYFNLAIITDSLLSKYTSNTNLSISLDFNDLFLTECEINFFDPEKFGFEGDYVQHSILDDTSFQLIITTFSPYRIQTSYLNYLTTDIFAGTFEMNTISDNTGEIAEFRQGFFDVTP